ncbi:hypothetical protein AB5I41_28075 [Sphingomonas sp. MMS24-JH45]
MTDAPSRHGLLLGVGAYILWGLLPLYLKLLAAVPAAQILAHRVLWSLILLSCWSCCCAALGTSARRRAGGRSPSSPRRRR